MTEETTFLLNKEGVRERLNKYTRKAFRMLPDLDKPRILDIGCGSGVPTMELARLSVGEITGLDIDQDLLNVLTRKIERAGLSDRVKTLKCSMFDMDLPKESFDIIWAEGSIAAIGFKRGLKEWQRLLKPDGFLVIHDERGNIEEKLDHVSACGYELLGYFTLNEDIWWDEYYSPLENLVHETRTENADNPEVAGAIHKVRWELDMFKKNPELNTSVFFVMKKN